MQAGDRIVHVCQTVLQNGPLGYTKQRDLWRRFAACGYDQDWSTMRSPWGTSCGIAMRAVLHWAGRIATRPGKIGQPVNNGWLEGMTFKHPAWVWNVGGAKPTPGCIFARDYNRATTKLYHVGCFMKEPSPGLWMTAEGGGGDGSEFRLSEKPKALNGKDGLNRIILGWWRPEALACGDSFAPGWEAFDKSLHELYDFPGLHRTDSTFRRAWIAMCGRLGCDPNKLAAIPSIESGFNAAAENPHGAVGLIQFMPFLLTHWGLTREAVLKMTALQQLPLVERFYAAQDVDFDDDPGTLYMLTFMPAAARFPDNYILGQKDSEEIRWGLSLHKIWLQNQGLDIDLDGDIEVGEVKKLARDRYASAKARGYFDPAAHRPTLKLLAGYPPPKGNGMWQEEVKLIQAAVGVKSDGQWGPVTDSAVEAWQRAQGLDPDKVFGPKSWAKLEGK